MPPLRIAVDATCWLNQRGYGRHARSLLGALAGLDQENHYTFFLDADPADPLPAGVEVRQVAAQTPASLAASAEGRRSLGDMWRMSRALSGPNFDLVLFPSVYTYVPVFSRARKIVMIHDVIAEKFPELTLPDRTARWMWNVKVALGRRQARAVVTVSEYSRRQIAAHFGMPAGRIFVAGEAGDPIFRRLENPELTPCLLSLGLRPGERWIAYVGGFGPHKNLPLLVESFAQIAGEPGFEDVRLVLVGQYRREVFYSTSGDLVEQVENLGLQERVIFTGYLPDEELVVLLNRAAVLALPSQMEGFGLPAVEAAACGCPVVATTESPLPELLGEGGLYVDPQQPAELSSALRQVLASQSLRRKMGQAGEASAQALTWEAAARQMMEVIQWTARA